MDTEIRRVLKAFENHPSRETAAALIKAAMRAPTPEVQPYLWISSSFTGDIGLVPTRVLQTGDHIDLFPGTALLHSTKYDCVYRFNVDEL